MFVGFSHQSANRSRLHPCAVKVPAFLVAARTRGWMGGERAKKDEIPSDLGVPMGR
jgi:hypothetical protein